MIEHRARAVSDHNFTSTDRLFLDTNIWIYVYGPQSSNPDPDELNKKLAATYSDMLRRIMAAGSQVYIDVLVVSEFINRCAKINWKHSKKGAHEDFKAYRNSDAYTLVATEIAREIKRILKLCLLIEDHFKTLTIDASIREYAEGYSDFNDQIITELCKRKELMLITHDGDFKRKRQEIPILTANRKLLS